MKKILSILSIMVIVVLCAGCVDSGDGDSSSNIPDIPSRTYSGDGISFQYPESWTTNLKSETPNTLAVVGDPKSQDADGNVNTLVVIQSTSLPSGQTLKETYDATYEEAASDPSFVQISEKTLIIDGLEAYENIHKVDVKGIQKKERAVWLEKNGIIYVILCGALPADFNAEQTNFDLIIFSFKIE